MRAIVLAAVIGSVAGGAWGQTATSQRTVEMRVGETRTLATVGGHRADCLTSVPARRIDVAESGGLGSVTRRENAPYTVGESLSHSCLGAHLFGTAIEFSARAAGTETVTIDSTFDNGVARRVVTVLVRP